MIEVLLNDRLGKKVRVKCNEDDTIGDLKKLVAAQTGTRPEKIKIQKWYTIVSFHCRKTGARLFNYVSAAPSLHSISFLTRSLSQLPFPPPHSPLPALLPIPTSSPHCCLPVPPLPRSPLTRMPTPNAHPDVIPSLSFFRYQYKDHITLEDYEIHDGMNLEMYYN